MKNLEKLINDLSIAKKTKDTGKIEEINKQIKVLLKEFSLRHYKFKIEEKSRSECEHCKKIVETKRLFCGHDFCKDCIIRIVKATTEGTFDKRIERTSCPICKNLIEQDCIGKFISKEEYAKFVEEGKKIQKKSFNCPICTFNKTVDDEGIIFGYNEIFCEDCAIAYVKSCITEGKVSEKQLTCPSCKKVAIDGPILEYLASKAECLDKLNYFSIKDHKTKNEYFKSCPKCSYGAIIGKNIKEFKCEICKVTICPNCNKKPHPGTCDEAKSEEEEKARKKMLDKMGFKVCPKCKAPVEKISGCNFISCYSPQCQGFTYFCYLCGSELTAYQHFSHYTSDGPYGNSCNNFPQ